MAKTRYDRQPVTVKDFTVVHKIGDCVLLSLRMTSGRGRYCAIYKNVRMEGATAKFVLYFLRTQVPRKARPQAPVKGEIVAYRVWKLLADCLVPVAVDPKGGDVDGPVLVADKLPTLNNYSGFWAVKRNLLSDLVSSYGFHAIGEVALFGRVVEHTMGWRAHKMIIRKLVIKVPCSDEFLELLARKYQCEVTRYVPKADEYEVDWGGML